jgi:hypothetical protein
MEAPIRCKVAADTLADCLADCFSSSSTMTATPSPPAAVIAPAAALSTPPTPSGAPSCPTDLPPAGLPTTEPPRLAGRPTMNQTRALGASRAAGVPGQTAILAGAKPGAKAHKVTSTHLQIMTLAGVNLGAKAQQRHKAHRHWLRQTHRRFSIQLLPCPASDHTIPNASCMSNRPLPPRK